METEPLPIFTSVATNTTEWYSEEYIRNSIVTYLKQNGYKIQKSAAGEADSKSIVASKFFKKEIIEVKGYPTLAPGKGTLKTNGTSHQAKHWFSEALLNSLTNFGYYYSSENVVLGIGLPNVERYRAIIERVNDYFTLNNLSFKIYLVNEDGMVEVSNLNSAI